ncbi:MAG: AraC family transcriptional regulator [Arenicella sp.]|nr:AraC family transcriptional regulator [Arenicella sp.]
MSETVFNIHDTLLLATAFQSFLFVLLILIAKYEPHANDYYLVGFFLAQMLIPLHFLVNFGSDFSAIAADISPSLYHTFDIALWLEGPLLLWYTRSLLNQNFKLGAIDLLYLAPSVAYLMYISVTFFAVEPAVQLQIIADSRDINDPGSQLAPILTRETLRVFFSVLCLLNIRQAQLKIRDQYSNIEKIDFNWLIFLVIAFTIVRVWVLGTVLFSIFAYELGADFFNTMGLIGNYLTFALISTLMFYSLQRSSVFYGHSAMGDEQEEAEEEVVDPMILRRIEQYMQAEKPYLNHRLNLDQLASELAMHPRTLSKTINRDFKTNFYEFINTYRIDEAKLKLADMAQKDKTMIEILGECGFNSKATYNTFFKKIVGSTPTQYRASKLKEA